MTVELVSGSIMLALLGLVVGVVVEGLASTYHYSATFDLRPCCRVCGECMAILALLPVSGLAQRSCRACGRPWWRQALTAQLLTAAVFVVLGIQYRSEPLLLGIDLVEVVLLLAVLFIDLELRLIPLPLIALLVALSLARAAVWPGLDLSSALLGGAVGFLSFLALVALARVAFGDGAFGLGDAYLALVVGLITGFPLVVVALSLGAFLGGAGAVVVIVTRRGGLQSTMPYGPYLVLALLYVLARGNTLTALYPLW